MLSAFYNSSDDDEIIDHTEVDDQLGTITDFEELLSQLNEKGVILLKIILLQELFSENFTFYV